MYGDKRFFFKYTYFAKYFVIIENKLMFVNSSVKQVKTTDKILTNDLFLSKKKKKNLSHGFGLDRKIV